MCQSAGLGDLQPAPGFLGQALVGEVFSAHKQRSCSKGAPRDTTTGDEKTNASFPNAIKTKKKYPLKQGALAGQGDDLELFAASSPSPPGPLPPWQAQGVQEGMGVTSLLSLPLMAGGARPSPLSLGLPSPGHCRALHMASDLIPHVSAVFVKNRSKLWPRKSHRKRLGLPWSPVPPPHALACAGAQERLPGLFPQGEDGG